MSHVPHAPVELPRVHLAGDASLHHAHLELTDHGVAMFLRDGEPYPFLDIDGTPAELRAVFTALLAALDQHEEAEQLVAVRAVRPARESVPAYVGQERP